MEKKNLKDEKKGGIQKPAAPNKNPAHKSK